MNSPLSTLNRKNRLAALPTSLQAAEVAHHSWRLSVAPTATPADLMEPTFWVHVTRMMRKGAVVDVFAEDASWYWRGIVRHVEGNSVYMGQIEEVHFDALPEPETKFRPSGVAA